MKLTSKIIFLIITGVFIGACAPAPKTVAPKVKPPTTRTDKEYDDRKKRKNRNNVIKRHRSNYSGLTCEKTKGHIQDKCEKICKELYKRRSDREDCQKLEVDFIEDLEEMYKVLENAKERTLNEIDSDLFETYINISIASLDRVVKEYNISKAKNFIYWLIDDEDIGEIFRNEDDDHDTLEEVLRQLDKDDYSNETNEIHKIFNKSIEGKDTLMEIIATSSDEVVEWFMDFINEKNAECKEGSETRLCFVGVYCRIGKDLDENGKNGWLSNQSFKDYLNKIINKKVNSQDADKDTDDGNSNNESRFNPEGWEEDDFDNVGDISVDWVNDLCLAPFPSKNADGNFIWKNETT